MKLYATVSSERFSRPAKKGADEYIKFTLSNGNIPIFEVTFKDDGDKRGLLEVMSFYNGETKVIPYME